MKNIKLTEKEAIEIAQQFQNEHPIYADDNLVQVIYKKEYDVKGGIAWIVIGETELFGALKNMFYVISDQTRKVEYTFDEYGNRDPHIEKPMPKEWEENNDEEDE